MTHTQCVISIAVPMITGAAINQIENRLWWAPTAKQRIPVVWSNDVHLLGKSAIARTVTQIWIIFLTFLFITWRHCSPNCIIKKQNNCNKCGAMIGVLHWILGFSQIFWDKSNVLDGKWGELADIGEGLGLSIESRREKKVGTSGRV